jgi:hypothetical protein
MTIRSPNTHWQFALTVLGSLVGIAPLAAAEPAVQSPATEPAAETPKYFPNDSRLLARVSEARLLADLSQAQPADALTAGRREPGKWKVISYAGENWEGEALSTFRDTGAATVSLPLEATGWHALYIGLGTVSGGLDTAAPNAVRVKLSGEPIFRRMANGLPLMKPRRDIVQEIFLTAADVTGQSLEIASVPFKPANVCYVKVVPLTQDEVARWQQPRTSPRTQIATFDGHSWIWPYRPRTKEHLRETFRGFERSDVGKWWFQVLGADLTCYPSKVGNIPGAGTRDFSVEAYREFTESLEALFAAGVNPLQVAREEAQRQGVEFHVMIRPAGWKGALPWDEVFNSRFFEEHPEWRCIDRDGTPTLYMSYAYPEVRRQVLAVLRETLELQPEGVGFLFHRGMPMILWEEPFCREFQDRYDADAREVAEDDPRILELRAELMTRMLTEVRSMLDEVANEQGRTEPYRISLSTFSKEADNRKFGLDVGRWAKEGLVNDLAVAYFAHHTSFSPPDMAYYRRVTEGTPVGLYPFVIAWHSGTPQQLCQKVTKFYDEGATGIAVWDITPEGFYRDGSPGNVFDIASRLGDRELIGRWSKTGPPQPHSLPLKRWADNHYSRWFPNTGF